MDVSTLKRIQADPHYQELVSERKSFSWTLTIITLVIYYGFIAIVAFATGVISAKGAGDITIGIILGVAGTPHPTDWNAIAIFLAFVVVTLP